MPATTSPPAPRLWRRTALATVLLAGTALGGLAVGHAGFAATESPATASTSVNPPGSNPTNGQVLPDFTNLVHQVKPAVVSITVKLKQNASEEESGQQQQQMPFPFGQMLPFGGMRPQMHAVEARGSGFIINADGTI